MKATDTTAEKRIVERLDFDATTTKRVAWEQFEFTVVAPHQVRVTNASYGYLKDDHSYLVGVETRNGVPVPAECECPADRHREGDCKHKVALATIGGLTVLNAAVETDRATLAPATFPSRALTDTDTLAPDGGVETCANGEEWCDGPTGDDLPCFACFDPEVRADE